MSRRNTIEYVCYNEECKHNDKGFCQLKGIKPNGCISAISKQGYELGIEWRDKEIDRLKKQLAVTEKALKLAVADKCKFENTCCGTIAEMIKHCDKCELCECIGCEHSNSAIEEIKELKAENEKLKQQLKEKDEEIEKVETYYKSREKDIVNDAYEIIKKLEKTTQRPTPPNL